MNCQERILEISKKFQSSHIGSCLSVLPIIEEIYFKKNPLDVVFLDNAHCHLAHLVVKEKYQEIESAEELFFLNGTHCDRSIGCDFSGGSLGHVGIAIGYAIGHPEKVVHVVISDGSCVEGSFAESLRVLHDLELSNLKLYANFNRYTATTKINMNYWENWIKGFKVPIKFYHTNNGLSELSGVSGHYEVLK